MGPTWWAVAPAPWWRPFGTKGPTFRAWGIGWAMFTGLSVLPHWLADRIATWYFGADPIQTLGADNTLVLPGMIANVFCVLVIWGLAVQPWIDRDRGWSAIPWSAFHEKWSWFLERGTRTVFYLSIIILGCLYSTVIGQCVHAATRMVGWVWELHSTVL